jgi:hypothetical protein
MMCSTCMASGSSSSTLHHLTQHVCACRFPMLFHSIVGKDERELQSPSWFNIHEAKLVLMYLQVPTYLCVWQPAAPLMATTQRLWDVVTHWQKSCLKSFQALGFLMTSPLVTCSGSTCQ